MQWSADMGSYKDRETVINEAAAVRAFFDGLGFIPEKGTARDLTIEWLRGGGLYQPDPPLLLGHGLGEWHIDTTADPDE
jgi:hypothetical protein